MKHIADVLPEALAHLEAPTQETKPMITLGIDIGLTGAVSAIKPDGTATIVDLPVRTDDRRIDARALIHMLRELVPVGFDALALIEDIRVRAMGNRPTTHSTEHSLSVSRGIVQATLDIARFKTEPIQPMNWKRFYGLIGADKDDALVMARKLYPDLQPLLARKKDHNRAESLLIAHFGARTMT